ncbi:MAG TPA: hypothetical protein VLB50_05315, partial [Ignavibacteriaceae bacterium]|nr:hypothetical protein [Ignavibacteriaceae bacterium]
SHIKLFFVFCITASFSGCSDRQIELKIIPSNQVAITWDSSVYQHTTLSFSNIDSSGADSIAQSLNKSNLLIEEMWYPDEDTRCALPMRSGSEIIIKLAGPDTGVFKYGFQKNSGGFPVNCFEHWRHYKFIYH